MKKISVAVLLAVIASVVLSSCFQIDANNLEKGERVTLVFQQDANGKVVYEYKIAVNFMNFLFVCFFVFISFLIINGVISR